MCHEGKSWLPKGLQVQRFPLEGIPGPVLSISVKVKPLVELFSSHAICALRLVRVGIEAAWQAGPVARVTRMMRRHRYCEIRGA